MNPRLLLTLILALFFALSAVGCGSEDDGDGATTATDPELTAQELTQNTLTLQSALEADMAVLTPVWKTIEAQGDNDISVDLTDEQQAVLDRVYHNLFSKLTADQKKNLRRMVKIITRESMTMEDINNWYTNLSTEGQKNILRMLLPWLRAYSDAESIAMPWNQIETDAQPMDPESVEGVDGGPAKKEAGLSFATQSGAISIEPVSCIAVVGAGLTLIGTGVGLGVVIDHHNDERKLMWECANYDFNWGWKCCYYVCANVMADPEEIPNCETQYETKPGDEGVDPEDCGDDYPYAEEKEEKPNEGKDPTPVPA
jgi:hypothetical protein